MVWREWPDSDLHIIFCDVGQGDATLLTFGFTQLLIDGGKDETVLNCLENNLPFWDRKIEVVVATHPDADHIGGLSSVLSQFSTDLIITNGAFKETDDFSEFKKAVSREISEKSRHTTVKRGDSIRMSSNIVLDVLSPQVANSVSNRENSQNAETELWDSSSDDQRMDLSSNDGSIVLFLRYKRLTTLLTGDLEEAGELALLKKGLIVKSDVLKVGHHGSKTSSSLDFLRKLRPEISVISSGENNIYNHPSPEVASRLHTFGTHTYRTDKMGTVRFASDGFEIWLY
jgi:competence protein ComEC